MIPPFLRLIFAFRLLTRKLFEKSISPVGSRQRQLAGRIIKVNRQPPTAYCLLSEQIAEKALFSYTLIAILDVRNK